jgi:hypothetical protein
MVEAGKGGLHHLSLQGLLSIKVVTITDTLINQSYSKGRPRQSSNRQILSPCPLEYAKEPSKL